MPRSESRVLFVDLARLGPGERVSHRSVAAEALEGLTGAAGPLLLMEGAATAGDRPAFAICVGAMVRRGEPTAARATVAALAPLTGRLAEGQIGGSLGRRLASVADAVVLTGTVPEGRAPVVVVIDASGEARVEPGADLAGLDPAATHRALVARFGACASLRVGPAAEHGARIASLASGEETTSFTGRGGLGAAFAAQGVKAVCVLAPEVASSTSDSLDASTRELFRALVASPRLRARAEDGTFELAPARAARGEITRDAAAALYDGMQATKHARTGCAGCPTPCGWTFERAGRDAPASGGEAHHARFGQVWSLQEPLGLATFDDALALAAACDAVGVDAKEAGRGLALLARAEGALGDRDRFEAWIADLGRGSGRGWDLANGAASLARTSRESNAESEEAAGSERGVAARLGALVSANGADPMRTFPFLLDAGASRVRALLGGDIRDDELDPRSPVGKGRLVAWHEQVIAAIDDAGFCVFSAAGLLADGLLDLDGLARVLGHPDGVALRAHGQAIVALRRRFNGWAGAGERTVPPDLRGAIAEYEAARAAAPPVAPPDRGPGSRGSEPVGSPAEARPGRVTLRATGPLAAELGREITVAVAGPGPWAALLDALPSAEAAVLMPAGELRAAAYRDGHRLRPDDLVRAGDVVDLVLAIAGG